MLRPYYIIGILGFFVKEYELMCLWGGGGLGCGEVLDPVNYFNEVFKPNNLPKRARASFYMEGIDWEY